MNSEHPLKRIRLTDDSFASRLALKYGWHIERRSRQSDMVHRDDRPARQASSNTRPVHLNVTRVYPAASLHLSLLYKATQLLRVIQTGTHAAAASTSLRLEPNMLQAKTSMRGAVIDHSHDVLKLVDPKDQLRSNRAEERKPLHMLPNRHTMPMAPEADAVLNVRVRQHMERLRKLVTASRSKERTMPRHWAGRWQRNSPRISQSDDSAVSNLLGERTDRVHAAQPQVTVRALTDMRVNRRNIHRSLSETWMSERRRVIRNDDAAHNAESRRHNDSPGTATQPSNALLERRDANHVVRMSTSNIEARPTRKAVIEDRQAMSGRLKSASEADRAVSRVSRASEADRTVFRISRASEARAEQQNRQLSRMNIRQQQVTALVNRVSIRTAGLTKGVTLINRRFKTTLAEMNEVQTQQVRAARRERVERVVENTAMTNYGHSLQLPAINRDTQSENLADRQRRSDNRSVQNDVTSTHAQGSQGTRHLAASDVRSRMDARLIGRESELAKQQRQVTATMNRIVRRTSSLSNGMKLLHRHITGNSALSPIAKVEKDSAAAPSAMARRLRVEAETMKHSIHHRRLVKIVTVPAVASVRRHDDSPNASRPMQIETNDRSSQVRPRVPSVAKTAASDEVASADIRAASRSLAHRERKLNTTMNKMAGRTVSLAQHWQQMNQRFTMHRAFQINEAGTKYVHAYLIRHRTAKANAEQAVRRPRTIKVISEHLVRRQRIDKLESEQTVRNQRTIKVETEHRVRRQRAVKVEPEQIVRRQLSNKSDAEQTVRSVVKAVQGKTDRPAQHSAHDHPSVNRTVSEQSTPIVASAQLGRLRNSRLATALKLVNRLTTVLPAKKPIQAGDRKVQAMVAHRRTGNARTSLASEERRRSETWQEKTISSLHRKVEIERTARMTIRQTHGTMVKREELRRHTLVSRQVSIALKRIAQLSSPASSPMTSDQTIMIPPKRRQEAVAHRAIAVQADQTINVASNGNSLSDRLAHRKASSTTTSLRVQSKATKERSDVPLQIAVKRSSKPAPHKEELKALETAIKKIEKNLNEAKVQWSKPSVNMKRMTDEMYREFARRIQLEQRRSGY